MANELEKAITIKSAIDNIDAGDFLLPSIQRRFVWNTKQIEFLFDSIMQDFPINTFMLWNVEDDKIKNQFRFYDFLKKYIEYEGGNNQERKTTGYKNFKAVIDGQQRLNSLYIGLKGSFAFKEYVYRKKNYYNNEESYPTRKLFLDILSPLDFDEEKKIYDFRFLIHNEHEKECQSHEKKVSNESGNNISLPCFWFEVGKILEFRNEHQVITFLSENKLDLGGFPGETLLKLYKLINERCLINFYLEKDQDFDKILYEFIRTNSGGTRLSFADLLMSIITASWEDGESVKGAREEFDKVIRNVGDIGFTIDQDFILKTCLVIVSPDIKFELKNFDQEAISKIKAEWGKITMCISSAFQVVNSFAFNNHALRAKNSVIPIIYFLYKTDLFLEINKDNKQIENKKIIKKYLHISLLNKLFGGSSDGFLLKLKKNISEQTDPIFPLDRFKEEFKGSNRRFYIDDEKLSSILRTCYGDLDCFYFLSLLFPNYNFTSNPNIDHLHPKSHFIEDKFSSLTAHQIEFYKTYYDTVLNLTLLSEEQNKSKKDKPLKEWLESQESINQNIRNALIIPENIDLSFENFQEFINQRENLFKEVIKERIN